VLERNVATERTLAIINRENSLVMVAPGRRVLELLGAVRPTDVALVEAMALDVAPVYDRLQPWNFSNGFLSRIPEHLVVTGAATLAGAIGGTSEAIERSCSHRGGSTVGGDVSTPRETAIAPLSRTRWR